ncbi:MAG: hypothetical protein ACK58M_19140 [Acidobacteriota bacterium]|jgi:hypothetical protein|nr:hypothetical protein [Acidobacteriaceae bacterium]
MMKWNNNLPVEELPGRVHCYMCTHRVEATVLKQGTARKTRPGQRCPRCSGSLDSGYVLEVYTGSLVTA